MGATSADTVARAVIRAIRGNLPEIIVNRPPLRPLFVLAEMFPGLAEWGIRNATIRFLRRVAVAKRRNAETVAQD
jgi:hypothetical protein